MCSTRGQIYIYKRLMASLNMKLKERMRDDGILLFDGAMGTELQKYNPAASDYPDGKNGFNDGLCITHPEWVQSVHRSYLEAGADCITTNTFGSNVMKLDEYGLGNDTEKINEDAAGLARGVVDSFDSKKYVIGSMGPSGYLPSIEHKPEEDVSLDTVEDAFYRQAVGLVRGGVDGLVLETSVDLLELKTIIRAARRVDNSIPIIANITLAQSGCMLLGTPVEVVYTTVCNMGIDVFGINCSTGPLEMEDCIRWLNDADNADHPILVVPNAGIPDMDKNNGEYPLQAAEMSEIFADMLRKYSNIRVVGGCCGTTPEHIRMLRSVIDRHEQQTVSVPAMKKVPASFKDMP